MKNLSNFFGWGDSGVTTVSHNFQFGVLISGDLLGLTGVVGSRRPVWVRWGGDTPLRVILRGQCDISGSEQGV